MKFQLTLMVAATALALPAWAAEQVEEVVVTATLRQSEAETALPVNLLSGDELRNAAAATLGETLSGQVGVSSASFGPGVGQPVIRGQSGNRVRVLQDGLGSLDASGVSPDHANTVEPIIAERIEVVRGPATLLYGSGAIGGVVNVVDNRVPQRVPEHLQGVLEQRHNSNNDEDVSVFKLDGGQGQFAWHLDGLYRDSNAVEIPGDADADHDAAETGHSEGVIENSDARAKALAVGGSWVGEQGFVGLAVSRNENNYGLPPGGHEHDPLAAEEPDIRIDMEQTRLDVKGEWLPESGWLETLRGRLSYNDYSHVELEGSEVGTEFSNEGWEGRLELVRRASENRHGALGLQLGSREFGTEGEEAYVPTADIHSLALFAVEDIHQGSWTYELGARVENEQVDPKAGCDQSATALSASASAIWHYRDDQHLFVSLGHAQRGASVEELFSNIDPLSCGPQAVLKPHNASQAVEVGNPELDKEMSSNLELAWRRHGENLGAEVNLFYSDFHDYIYLADTGALVDGLPLRRYRQQGATFHGAELELTVPLASAWETVWFVDYVRAELDDGSNVPRLPPLRYGVTLDYGLDRWSAKLRLMRAAKQDEVAAYESETEAYTLVTASAQYVLPLQQRELTLFVKADNLLDEEVRLHTSFLKEVAPEPGRGYTVGLRYQF